MQNCSVLVHASPAAPATSSTPPTSKVTRSTPAPSVTREHVWQRCWRFDHQPMAASSASAAQDVLNDVLDLGVVLCLERLVLLFPAIDLDRRVGGDLLGDGRLAVGLALVFLGHRLEGRAVLL